jgi:antitoxin YefM
LNVGSLGGLRDRSARPPGYTELSGTRSANCVDVTRIMVMSDVVLPLAEIKKRLSEIVDGVEVRHDRVVLTRHGRPAAVIISPDDLESLEETLELLSNPRTMRDIRKAEAAVEAREVVTADELRSKYLKR